jgi:alginate O-acetyltransferase complex protein AlgI
VIWGAIHGGMLSFERMMGKDSFYAAAPKPLKVAFTFLIILVTWVFFRAENFDVAARYLGAMFGGGAVSPAGALLEARMLTNYHVLQIIICAFAVWVMPNTQTILHRFIGWKAALGGVLFTLAVMMMFARGFSPFLYLQF